MWLSAAPPPRDGFRASVNSAKLSCHHALPPLTQFSCSQFWMCRWQGSWSQNGSTQPKWGTQRALLKPSPPAPFSEKKKHQKMLCSFQQKVLNRTNVFVSLFWVVYIQMFCSNDVFFFDVSFLCIFLFDCKMHHFFWWRMIKSTSFMKKNRCNTCFLRIWCNVVEDLIKNPTCLLGGWLGLRPKPSPPQKKKIGWE